MAFERAALAEGLRYMEQTLKSRDQEVFQHRTELQLLQHVVELKVEDATQGLNVQLAKAESEKADLEVKLAKLQQRDALLGQALRKAGERCGAAAKKADLTAEKAKETLADLERKLATQAESLKG